MVIFRLYNQRKLWPAASMKNAPCFYIWVAQINLSGESTDHQCILTRHWRWENISKSMVAIRKQKKVVQNWMLMYFFSSPLSSLAGPHWGDEKQEHIVENHLHLSVFSREGKKNILWKKTEEWMSNEHEWERKHLKTKYSGWWFSTVTQLHGNNNCVYAMLTRGCKVRGQSWNNAVTWTQRAIPKDLDKFICAKKKQKKIKKEGFWECIKCFWIWLRPHTIHMFSTWMNLDWLNCAASHHSVLHRYFELELLNFSSFIMSWRHILMSSLQTTAYTCVTYTQINN